MRQPVELGADEARFVLSAVEHYCSMHCPLETGEGKCSLIGWRESVHTGAIERICKVPSDVWQSRFGARRAPGRPSRRARACS